MSKKAFTIEGDFQMGRARQHFSVQMIGTDEDDARNHLLKDLGSRHGVARRQVSITSVTPVADGDVEPITAKRLARGE